MPAIITHHLFGEDAARRLPDDLALGEEELLAFLLGNQGPDPFYFCFTATPSAIASCHEFAASMHSDHVGEALRVARDAVSYLPRQDQGIGRAFVLGLLAHYLLDSEAHAFIMAQEQGICEAGVGLENSHDEVHALIESDLDSWLLWTMRTQTVDDAPAASDLARTERIARAAGAIFSQVAWQVFGITLGADRYEGCVRDYEFVYRAIDPIGNPRGWMIAGIERLGVRSSRLGALAHTATPSDECAAANLARCPWVDPLTGQTRTTSFPDIFFDALEHWPDLAEAYVRGDADVLAQLMRRAYDGRPLGR